MDNGFFTMKEAFRVSKSRIIQARLLVANPLNRYLINSLMLPDLKRDADGGVTLYIQHGSPGKDKESNWLPAPSGPFLMFLRLFWPKPEALDGKWKQPPLQRAERLGMNTFPPIKDSRRIGPSASVQAQGETSHVVSYRRCDTHHLKELHEWQQATRIDFLKDLRARLKFSES